LLRDHSNKLHFGYCLSVLSLDQDQKVNQAGAGYKTWKMTINNAAKLSGERSIWRKEVQRAAYLSMTWPVRLSVWAPISKLQIKSNQIKSFI